MATCRLQPVYPVISKSTSSGHMVLLEMALGSAFVEYLSQRIYGPASGVLVVLGLLVGVIGAAGTYMSWADGPAPWLMPSLLAMYPVVLTIWVLYREIDLARRRRYTPALIEVRSCFRDIQQIDYILHNFSQNDSHADSEVDALHMQFSEKMREILSSMARCFTTITGVPCRACIKVIPEEDLVNTPLEEIAVLTMARDRDSQEQNEVADEQRYSDKVDKIILNSDFLTLYDPSNPDEWYYIYNNIPKQFRMGKYKNSSISYRKNC